jgi:hypothetical protein
LIIYLIIVAAAAATAKIQAMDAVQANVLSATTPTLGLKTLSSSSPSVTLPIATTATIPPPTVLPTVIQPSHILSPGLVPSITTSITAPTDGLQATLSSEEIVKQKQEELQKKLLEEGEPTLQQQESMSIKGQNARHLVMQRLMRPRESKVVILRNMVGPEVSFIHID